MLNVRLFGPGQASYLGHEISGFPQQQNCLLLCYLMLNRNHPHNRERLSAVFWGEEPTPIARKNFRNTLWRMRQALAASGAPPDDYIYANEVSIGFINYSAYWLDVDVFETAALLARQPDQALSPGELEQIEVAVRLYTGDLLENIYADWCVYERERLRLLYLNMVSKLMLYYAARGEYERGLGYGERILACDSTREDVHRQMMWMHWRSGNRYAALAQYKVCCQALRQEAGVAPMEITHKLYEQLLHQPDEEPRWPTIGQPAAQKTNLTPLTQTALDQLQHLQQVLEQTHAELLKIEQMIYRALGDSGQL